jgi:5-methylcytosine-specific restriction protein A
MSAMATRNPAWTRDELILALDLYFRHPPSHISKDHPEVRKLSELLNALPIHKDRPDAVRFRNENGVYTKLCNFLRFDPSYGKKGLTHGGAGDEVVWEEFSEDKNRLGEVARAIRANVDGGQKGSLADGVNESAAEPEEDEFPEGRVLYRTHRARERNRTLIQSAKRHAMKANGNLSCQACGFIFKDKYGVLGDGYIECHHVLPVSTLKPNTKTKLVDIALLCSNCHRMVHRRRPWLSMEDLRLLIES